MNTKRDFFQDTQLKPGDSLPGKRLPAAKVYASPIETVTLPEPPRLRGTPVWKVLRSLKAALPQTSYSLPLADFSQLLLPLSARDGRRGYPSEGDTYPLEAYIAVQHVQDIYPGVYHYAVKGHQLEQIGSGFDPAEWQAALWDLAGVELSACLLALTIVPERSSAMYGPRGHRYALLEVGYAVGELMVAASALGLAATPVTTFYDEQVREKLFLPASEHPVVVLAVGG